MKALKVLAVVGLAVALVTVPALTQGQQPNVIVNVTCNQQANKINISLNPVKLVIAKKDIARWVFVALGAASVGQCKVKDGKLDPNGDTLEKLGLNRIKIVVGRAELIKLEPNPVDWSGTQQQPSEITGTPVTPGKSKYSIQFIKFDKQQNTETVLLEIKDASELEIIVETPTLTEWGLIALAVLLAGSMGYMLYRRRPALHPAAP